jgi:pimeloyl-ACP methyl ester carboxylesterase
VKLSILIMFLFSSATFAGSSLLDSEAMVSGFGKIKYRAPKVQSNETPIVLFHGIYGGASHRTWRKLVPELEKLGKEVYILDLPGVGESDKPKRSYTIADFDDFVEKFLVEVVHERANIVSESILSNSVLKVAANRQDIVRRAVIINPSGINSLAEPPSAREQGLYDRLFFDDNVIDADLISDFTVMQSNVDQRFLTLSFVGGQLYRKFSDAAQGVFIPVLGIFGAEYEGFQDNKVSTANDFKQIKPYFEYVEIPGSGSSVQREKAGETAQEIVDFLIID